MSTNEIYSQLQIITRYINSLCILHKSFPVKRTVLSIYIRGGFMQVTNYNYKGLTCCNEWESCNEIHSQLHESFPWVTLVILCKCHHDRQTQTLTRFLPTSNGCNSVTNRLDIWDTNLSDLFHCLVGSLPVCSCKICSTVYNHCTSSMWTIPFMASPIWELSPDLWTACRHVKNKHHSPDTVLQQWYSRNFITPASLLSGQWKCAQKHCLA